MNTDRVSILIGAKDWRYSVINKAVGIIKDTYKAVGVIHAAYDDRFSINDLTSLDSFSTEEKEYLRNIFSHNITIVEAWEHSFHFYFHENLWHYDESGRDYRTTMRYILVLLNTSAASIGETVYTNDYRLIEELCHGWGKLFDEDARGFPIKSDLSEVKPDTVQFISHSLKTRVGDTCEFNFEFVKSFAESVSDHYQKRIYEAIMGYPRSDDF